MRLRAEELLRRSQPLLSADVTEDTQALVYELCVSQTELKLQNEELLRAQEQLAESRNRFQDLYQRAPIGYLTTDEQGVIVEANLTSADLLQEEHSRLIGRVLAGYVDKDSLDVFDTFVRHAVAGKTIESCEIRLKRRDGGHVDVQLTCRTERSGPKKSARLQMTLSDITLLKQTQARLRNINETLERRITQGTGFTKLLGDIARISNESDTVDDAFRTGLELICSHMRWAGGHIWMVEADTITDSGIWFRDYRQSFSDIIKSTNAVLGETASESARMIQRVAQTGEPTWTTQAFHDQRAQAIRAADYKMTLWFPIKAARRVAAILEFFTQESHVPEETLLTLMEQAGTQLGLVVQRKEAEHALRESEQRFRVLFEGAPVGIALSDLDGRPILVNRALQVMLGRSQEELHASSYRDFLYLPDAERGQALFEELAGGRRNSYDIEVRYQRKDNRTRWARAHVRLLRCQSGWPSHTMAIVEDITDRKELERAVAELTVHEQQKILDYLHDDLGQQLTGMGYVAKSVQHRLEAKSAPEADTVAELVKLIVKTHDQLRLLVAGLGPVDSETKSLTDALAQLAASTTELSGVPCVFSCPSPVSLSDTNAAMQLSYICQEAVASSLRAGASYIHISLKKDRQGVTLMILCDRDLARSTLTNEESIGLRIMRYRASLIGADLDITSTKEKGAVITCVLRGEAYEDGEQKLDQSAACAHSHRG